MGRAPLSVTRGVPAAQMIMGATALVVNLTLFRRLSAKFGLYGTGAIGALCSALAPIIFLQV